MKILIDFHGAGNAWFDDLPPGEAEAWVLRSIASHFAAHPGDLKDGFVDSLRDGNGNSAVKISVSK